MATCKQVIERAYRRSGVTAAGVTLNATQVSIGLERLIDLYNRMLQTGLLGILEDYYWSTGAYTAKENQRIYKKSGAGSLTYPQTITDADTGAVRPPKDGSVVVLVDATNYPTIVLTQRVYDALSGWIVWDNLTENSVAPLSGRNQDHIINMLAVTMADEDGFPITPLLVRNASVARMYYSSRYDQARKSAVQVFM